MYPKLHQKRIPTVFAFVLLLLGIGVTIFLVQRGTFIVSQAAPDHSPRDVVVSNVTDNSFTVTFWTQDPSTTAIVVEGDFYLSDLTGEQAASSTHSIEVRDLEPGIEYDFSIVSQGEEYLNGDELHMTMTADPLPGNFPEIIPLSGRVLLPDGGAASGALVYLTVEDSQIVSTVTGPDGEYVFNFPGGIRTNDLKGFYILEDGDFLHLVSRLGSLSSDVTSPYGPVLPPITLSYTFSFEATPSATLESTQSAEIFSIDNIPVSSGFTVLSPIAGDSLVDRRPTILGAGVPASRVTVAIEPGGISESVAVDESGRWSYRPNAELAQGQTTLRVTGLGPSGVSQTRTVQFQIFPSGSQVSQTATPSATPIPSITSVPTPTATVIPTLIATPPPAVTPTPPVGGVSVTPSPSLTLTPTVPATPTMTPFLKVTPTPPGSVGGVILTFTSLAFIVTGAALLFFLG